MPADDVTIVKGACPVCGRNCHVLVHMSGDRITKVERDPESRMSPTPQCARIIAAIDYHYHPQRLNYPLKRSGKRGEGKWERISWDQALDEIAARLAVIRDSFGPEALAALGGNPKGPGDPACWKWCNLWGTPNFVHQGKNCGEAEFLTECAMYGYDTSGSGPNAKTKVGIMWGANYAHSRELAYRNFWLESKKAGMKLVVIDPRPTPAAEAADIWLRLRPGSDGVLALGMLNVIISRGLHDKQFVQEWCTGFDELANLAAKYSPEMVAEMTWVPAEKVVETAVLYSTSKPALLSFGVANCHLGRAGLSGVLGKSWLRAVTGNLDREGGNMIGDWPAALAFLDEIDWDKQIYHPLRKHDNVSAHVWPVASVKALAMYREAMKKVHPKGFGGAQYFVYPAPHFLWTAILEGQPYPLKAVIDQGTNSLCCLGNGKLIAKALTSDNLSLHVSMDHFLSPTGALADYVLPATDGLERDNISNYWGLGNAFFGREKAVHPLHERRDDYMLWKELGTRLGQKGEWPETAAKWFDRLLAPQGCSFKEFAAGPGYLPPRSYERYRQTGFGTFSGKVELVPSILQKLGCDPMAGFEEPTWSPVSSPAVAREYPLLLIAGSRLRPFCHSQHRQLAKLRRLHPNPLLQINPETAAKLGIADGATVRIETPLGSVKQRAQFVKGLDPRVVHADGYWWYPEKPEAEPSLFGVWDSNINSIIPDDPEFCDYTGDNYLGALLCWVSKDTDNTL